jgi:hypothetical protein
MIAMGLKICESKQTEKCGSFNPDLSCFVQNAQIDLCDGEVELSCQFDYLIENRVYNSVDSKLVFKSQVHFSIILNA